VARHAQAHYLARFAGTVTPVLWEHRERDGAWSGLTDNYIRVRARSQRELRNVLAPARLVAPATDGFDGEVL
jgi:threonylcarbamoyladenosine tRNA methylthiotransferase MtaB